MVSSNQDKNRIINVAIIGGGISGIASAVRLKEALGKNVKITVSIAGSAYLDGIGL